MTEKFNHEKYSSRLEYITNFFEDFDYEIKECFSKYESQILCKNFYFLCNQWQLTRTEYEIAKVDPNAFLDKIMSLIERFKNAYQRGCDWIEMDSQLIDIYHLLQKKYISLRGDEYYAVLQKHRDACVKGGLKTTSIYEPQKNEAEKIYIEYKKENPELIEQYNQCQKNRKPNRPITVLKKMLLGGIKAPISDDTALRWAKELLKTDGVLVKTQQPADTGLKEK